MWSASCRCPCQHARRFSGGLHGSGLKALTQAILDAAAPKREEISALSRLMVPTPVSIVALAKAAADSTPKQMLLNANFIHRELAARRVQSLSMLLRAEQAIGSVVAAAVAGERLVCMTCAGGKVS